MLLKSLHYPIIIHLDPLMQRNKPYVKVNCHILGLEKWSLKRLKGVVTDVSVFGVHSLRSGGATAAANAGVSDRHFERHGRWKSETAKDGYVKDSLSSRLQVSRNIGL